VNVGFARGESCEEAVSNGKQRIVAARKIVATMIFKMLEDMLMKES